MPQEPRADIRHAVQRLIAACRGDVDTVIVRRKDLELLLVVNAYRIQRPTGPLLNPAQR